MFDVEQFYVKLKPTKALKRMGKDSQGNQYRYDNRSKSYKRLDKDGKLMNLSVSKRIKIIDDPGLPSRSFNTFDVETKDGLSGTKLFCWALSYRITGGLYRVLEGKEDLKPLFEFYLEKYKKKQLRNGSDGGKNHRKAKTNIYVHNLSFDIRFIIDYCIKNEITFKPILSGSQFIACIIEDYGMQFIDSLQFLKTSQEKAEIEWNIESGIKKEETKDLMTELFRNKKYKQKLKPYEFWSELEKETLQKHCNNDVVSLHKVMVKFRNEIAILAGIDMLNFISLASLAMKALRTTLKTEIVNPFLSFKKNDDGKITYRIERNKESFVRASYYGGRNEIYKLGLFKDMDYIDVVSMYSDAMRNNMYPSGVPSWLGKFKDEKEELVNIIQGKDDRLGFIKVKISKGKSHTNYPPLPKRLSKKVMFTNCEFEGVYTSVELQYAYKMGYKIDPIEGLIYPEKQNYFKAFVDKFYPIKANNKGGRKHAAKIILNSPYGKFGQAFEKLGYMYSFWENEDKMNDYLNFDLDKEIKITDCHAYKNDQLGMYQLMIPVNSSSKKSFMNIGLASFITSYSRLTLVKMLHLCEKYKIEVYYVDTDSFTIKHSDYLRLNRLKYVKKHKIFGKELGCWDIEQHFEEVNFVAPKCYGSIIMNEKTGKSELHLKMKGIAKATNIEMCEKIEEMYKKDASINRMSKLNIRIRQRIVMLNKYMTFKQAYRKGFILGSYTPSKHYLMKNFKRNFDKKTKNSKPWEMKDLPVQFKEDLFNTEENNEMFD